MQLLFTTFFCLILAYGSNIFFGKLEAHRQNLKAAEREYQHAIDDTKAGLVGLTASILSDRALLANLDNKMSHSLEQALEAKLKPGTLDQIELYTTDCTLVSWSLQSGRKPLPCNKALVHEGAPSFVESGSMITVQRLVQVRKDLGLVVQGHVDLDQEWRMGHPNIAGPVTNDVPTWLARSVPMIQRWLRADQPIENPVTGAAILIAGLVSLIAFLRRRREMAEYTHDANLFLSWCEFLSRESPDAVHDALMQERNSSQDMRFNKAKLSIIASIREKHVLHAKLQKECDEQKKAIAQLQNKSDEQSILLGNLASQDALALQVQRASPHLIDALDQLDENLRDVASILRAGILPPIKTIQVPLDRWQTGIEAAGGRRFMRSLYESQDDPEGPTQLDIDLKTFTESLNQLRACSMGILMRLPSLLRGQERLTGVLASWYSLVRSDINGEQENSDLKTMLGKAQQLLNTMEGGRSIAVEVSLSAGERGIPPKVPDSAAVSALFHLLSALSLGTQASGSKGIAIQGRESGGRSMLVLSTKGAFRSDDPIVAKHLRIAALILGSHNIAVQLMPSADGSAHLAIAWDLVRTLERVSLEPVLENQAEI